MLEFASPQRPLRERDPSDGDAHTRCLPSDAAFSRYRFGASDDTLRDEAVAALVLAREHEYRVTLGDEFTAVHRLLCGKRERPRPRIADLSFDRERHASLLPPRLTGGLDKSGRRGVPREIQEAPPPRPTMPAARESLMPAPLPAACAE